MKKLLFVAVLGAFVACNDTKTEGSADSTSVDTMSVVPMDTTSTMAPMDTTSTMMMDTTSKMMGDSMK